MKINKSLQRCYSTNKKTLLLNFGYQSNKQPSIPSLLRINTIFLFSEIYIFLLPDKANQEVNLSLVWLILVLGFSFRLLLTLTGQYFEVRSILKLSVTLELILLQGVYFPKILPTPEGWWRNTK